MVDRGEYERWRREADQALRHAELAAQAGPFNWACFGAEQAAQLAVKGLLHGLGRGPWGHDLVALGEALSAAGLAVPASARLAMLRLSRHYMPTRYPDTHPGGSPSERYTTEDAQQAMADARIVLGLVDAAWDDLDQ